MIIYGYFSNCITTNINVMQKLDNYMKPIPPKTKVLCDAIITRKACLWHLISIRENGWGIIWKQAFDAVSIFHEIKDTDQDKIAPLKNKKENSSTKKAYVKRANANSNF